MANPENFTYERKYTLTSTEINTLACRLLQSQPPKTSDRFICYLLSSADEISNLARHAEREAFLEFFWLDDAAMNRYYGPYELSSTFFVVMDTTYNKPAGVVRIVKNSLAGIPTLNDAPKYIGVTLDKFKAYHKVDNLDTVWDISTVVVLKDYRRIEESLVSSMLLRAMEVRAAYEGVHHFVAISDKHSRKRLFWPLEYMGEPIAGSSPVEHEGSTDSIFAYQHRRTLTRLVAEAVKVVDGKLRPSAELFKRRWIDGEGIDHRFMFQFSKDIGYDSATNKKLSAKL